MVVSTISFASTNLSGRDQCRRRCITLKSALSLLDRDFGVTSLFGAFIETIIRRGAMDDGECSLKLSREARKGVSAKNLENSVAASPLSTP